VTDRADFIGRIRREIGRTLAPAPAAPSPRPADPAAAAEAAGREAARRWREALEQFRREFEGVAGVFHRAPSREAVAAVVGRIARERGVRRVVTWSPSALGADLGERLRGEALDTVALPDGPVDAGQVRHLRAVSAASEIGLTGADLAIAETGTLVLASGPGRWGSTSLLPEYHLAVFDRRALVESLAQAAVILEAWHADRSRPPGGAISFITGPSRTADIELTLTRGVHGPREVHAIFVEPE
jgi:L-lactate dehydrogenase complex protein LldG